MIPAIKGVLAVFLLILAVKGDIKTRKIPNRLTVPFALIGLGFNAISNFPQGILTGAFGFVLGFFVFLLPYLMKGMGAGDVKLMAALGAITDWRTVLFIALFTALSGGIITIIIKARGGGVIRTFKRTGQLLAFYFFSLLHRMTTLPTMEYRKEKYRLEMTDENSDYIPYALAIAAGSVITLILSRIGALQGLSI